MLFLETVAEFRKDFSDICHRQQPLSESAFNQSADFIIYRVITKIMFYEKGQQLCQTGQLVEFLSKIIKKLTLQI